jgi:hypothetical protein
MPRSATSNVWGFEYLNFFCILSKYNRCTLTLTIIGKDVSKFDLVDEHNFKFYFPVYDKHELYLVSELLKSIDANSPPLFGSVVINKSTDA